MGPGRCAVLRQQISPNPEVTVLDFGEFGEYLPPLRVPLHRGERTIEVGRVAFILPMLAKGLEVGCRRWRS
jgi:hypothetical protein